MYYKIDFESSRVIIWAKEKSKTKNVDNLQN